jgi:hypothetical protein
MEDLMQDVPNALALQDDPSISSYLRRAEPTPALAAAAVEEPKPEDTDIDWLARIIRDEMRETKRAVGLTLDHAMKAGDALIKAQPLVVGRGIPWKKWLKDDCFAA